MSNEIIMAINQIDSLEQKIKFLYTKYSGKLSSNNIIGLKDFLINEQIINNFQKHIKKINFNSIINKIDIILENLSQNKSENIGLEENIMKYILNSLDKNGNINKENKEFIFIFFLYESFNEFFNVDKESLLNGKQFIYEEIFELAIVKHQIFLNDLNDIIDSEKEINRLGNLEDNQGRKYKLFRKFYQNEIYSVIKDLLGKDKYNDNNEFALSEDEIDSFIDEVLSDFKFEQVDEKIHKTLKEKIKEIGDRLVFFHNLQKSMKKGFIISLQEKERIERIKRDFQNGKIISLLGETGSGKTELAIYICTHELKVNPIVLSGTKDIMDDDLTLEKIITSRSLVDLDGIELKAKSDKAGLSEKEFINQTIKDFLGRILKTEEFKNGIRQSLHESGQSEEKINELINNINGFDYNLFTEYHLKGLFKAMYEGRPLIIDEINIIRPEIIMGLNHYLTRKVGDEIELTDGLGKFKIKKGFGVIFTGNDPDAYTLSNRYKSGRYSFDEAFYNRLSVYQKDYARQVDEIFKENQIQGKDTVDYVKDNELFILVLTMLFSSSSKIMISQKFGFEMISNDFTNKSKEQAKIDFIEKIKRFSNSINQIQKAYSGKTVSITKLNSSISTQVSIKKAVFTMRTLINILDKLKNNSLSIEYHIYNEYISKIHNIEEKYSVIAIFYENGFYQGLVGDDIKQTFDNLDKEFGLMRNANNSLVLKHKEKPILTNKIIGSRLIFTKQDLYKYIFGGDVDIQDNNFFDLKPGTLKDENNSFEKLEENNNTINEGEFEKAIDSLESLIQNYSQEIEVFDIFLLDKIIALFKEKKDQFSNDIKIKIVYYIFQYTDIIINKSDYELSKKILKDFEFIIKGL